MSTLYLVQHGLALPRELDPERGLSPGGIAEVERVARWAAGVGVQVAEIRHSGKLRARQTAELLGGALDPLGGIGEAPGLAPNDPVEALELADGLMLVGHLPSLGRLAGWLVAGDPDCEVVRLRNAGLVCLDGEGGRWALRWAMIPELCPV